MTTLTNTAIAALRDGQSLRDDRVPGLSVRAHGAGKSFMLYYRTKGGVERRPKIGDAAVLSISEARELARSMLAQVAAGADPAAARAAERHEMTLDDLWRRVEREHYSGERGWDREARRIYDREIRNRKHAGQRLGSVKVSALDVEHLETVHCGLKDTPFLANRAIAILGKALKLAEKWHLRPKGSNPSAYIERFAEPSRRRFATPEEIAKLGQALEKRVDEDPAGVAFLYVLLFSGARPSEIERATPAMLHRVEREDGTVCGVLRLPSAKTGPRDVFLPAQAMAVLDRLPASRARLAGRGTLPRKLWGSIRKEIGCPDLWARDMRRTFASVGFSLGGVDKGTMGNLLGHASVQTTEIYAKLLEDPAHRAAAATADAISGLLGRRSG